ncbi:MAG: hypothetical protein KR126chlam3_00292 [Chlamydiae bacterium]|nr:hypothetical protein [Chlamydiota bacterium]
MKKYSNKMKNWEFNKEVPPIFRIRRAAVFIDTERGIGGKSVKKLMRSKTNSSFCLSILGILILLCSFIHAAPIPAGKGFFQTENIDASTGRTDATYYPLLAAPDKVSVTTSVQNPNALVPPFRVHSWMGGAILWATGELETDPSDGFFVARNVPATNIWPAELFQQAPLAADPIIFQYFEPPNQAGSDPNSRGINLCAPFPYYIPEDPYAPSCAALDPAWQVAPLLLQNDAQLNLLIFPSPTAPVDGVASGSMWAPNDKTNPNSILVDRMGDYDTDLIFQNPKNPYGTPNASNPNGRGDYIKCTIVQGSPFVFCEVRGVNFVELSNRMDGPIVAATAAAAVPGVSKVDYARFGGNQDNPGIFAKDITLNPEGLQDNFTTWAVYFNNDIGITFVPGTATTQPQNSHLEFPNTTDRFFFVIAAMPTIFAYPTAGDSYAVATTAPDMEIDSYAKELGKYAFNFVTDTKISYSVTDLTFLETTFNSTLANPYNDNTMVAADSTVLCLQPHHYQNQEFDTSLTPTVLDLDGSSDFIPPDTDKLFYWTVRGNLKAILGKGFKTNYIYTNFLPSMPPPFWTDPAPTAIGTTTIGQLLFDNIDNEYVNNLSDKAFAPWNTAYLYAKQGDL